MSGRVSFVLLAAVLVLPGLLLARDLPARAADCPAGTERFTEYRLFFGRNLGDREVVSDPAWRDFLATEITARFPDGLTVMDAAGQWRDGAGRLIGERTKLVLILAAPGAEAAQRVEAIVEAYKARFGQESVLRAVGAVCAAF